MNDQLRIAIVDSGIDRDAIVRATIVAEYESVTGQDVSGHGTACAGIISSYVKSATLLDFRLFDSTLACRGQDLVEAIGRCVAASADVVNLSLGTTDVAAERALRDACAKAVASGTIIVAAEHNLGLESYPASFPEVIGVTGGRIHQPGGYYYRPGEPIECVARGDEQRLCWVGGKHVFLAGNSFAAPHITGIIARWLEEEPGMTLPEVRQKLRENAIPEPEASRKRARVSFSAPSPPPSDDLGWIRKAVLYPMNKEMHAMIRFPDLLPFKVVGAADHVGKGLVGKDAGEAVGVEKAGFDILPRIDALLDLGADTLVLGYVDQLGRIQEKDLVGECVGLALDHGLNVFSFLPVRPEQYGGLHDRAKEKGLRIAYPDVTVEEANHALQYPNQYPQVDVPVVAVLGTSSQQGKFTLQLALRRRLKALGYRVGQLGTEHHSRLFGMDAAFPIGHASPARLPIRYHIPYLDFTMRRINDTADPDLTLVGSQSGTIPFDIIEHSTHSVTSVPFLLGTKPDACVLVVNSIDPEDYVQDTIDAIRSVAKCKTLAIAMSDKAKHVRSAYGRSLVTPEPMSTEAVGQHLARLRDRFGLPAFCISRTYDTERLTDTVLEYFAEPTQADRVKEEANIEYAAD